MYNLKQLLLKEIERDGSTKVEYIRLADFSNVDGLYKFLNDESREMKNFEGILNMVKHSFPQNEREIMKDYIRTLNPNGRCARVALEYAASNRMYDLTYYLIDKLSKSKNAESREWASLYSLDRKIEEGSMNHIEVLDSINRLRLKNNECAIFGKILSVYAYHKKRIFNMTYSLSEELNLTINTINDGFIRRSYSCRLGVVMMSVNMHQNKLSDAEKFANLVLSNTSQKNIEFLAHFGLGNIYTFESYDKSIKHLLKARAICLNLPANNEKLAEVERSINFVSSYWGINSKYIKYNSNNISDIHGLAFYNILNKQFMNAKRLLESINYAELSDYQRGFHHFYKGLISRNKEEYYKSIFHFKEAGEIFYRNAPLLELEKLGENQMLLLALGN